MRYTVRVKCSNDWCNGVAKARGLCPKCYLRMLRGKPYWEHPRKKAPSGLSDRDHLGWIGWTVVQRDTPHAEGPCWEWSGRVDKKGYGVMSTQTKKQMFAHRVSYAAYVGEPYNLSVLHRCDNPPCVNPSHLWLGTAEDNLRDMASKERGNTRALYATDVLLLRSRPLYRGAISEWAKEFGVNPSTISKAIAGVTWKHL